MLARARDELSASIQCKQAMLGDAELLERLVQAAVACSHCLLAGGRVLFCGNGGSAADAQHWAGELMCRFYFDRQAAAGIALTTDSSVLTAIGNDYGFEHVFARQVRALGRPGDVLVAISTSGNSANIINALETAATIGLKTIGFTGCTGGKMAARCDVVLHAPSDATPRIQECHGVLGHILCGLVEEACFGQAAGTDIGQTK